MIVVTDNIEFARNYIDTVDWHSSLPGFDSTLNDLIGDLYEDRKVYYTSVQDFGEFKYLFIAKKANQSHYDLVIDYCKQGRDLPHGILCLAGSSEHLHGFKNRKWAGLEGNIHLVAYFKPEREIHKFGPGFMTLAAVSAIEAIDEIDPLKDRAMIKWVNDIMIDNAKVCGVLAYSQSEGKRVTDTVIGIGMNVEKKPQIEPTPFVPEATCLTDHVGNKYLCKQSIVFGSLLKAIHKNYNLLISGDFAQIFNIYVHRSMIRSRYVNIYPDREYFEDSEIIGGVVSRIGDNLELYLEGYPKPVTKGRLELKRT